MPVELLLATRNAGKIRELEQLLRELPIQLLSLDDAGVDPDFDVEEIGETFTDISLLKAKEYAGRAGVMTVADDSGLCVNALGGKPGVRSKRFVEGSDHDRNLKILDLLQGEADRTAYFITVLCLYNPETDQAHFFEGRVDGVIADQEKGSEGFGYDPIFIPEGYQQSFAELGVEVKNTLSHRARALQKLKIFLEAQLNNGK